MNRGTVGFLMNDYKVKGLPERLTNATPFKLNQLKVFVTDQNGDTHRLRAINELSLF